MMDDFRPLNLGWAQNVFSEDDYNKKNIIDRSGLRIAVTSDGARDRSPQSTTSDGVASDPAVALPLSQRVEQR